MDSLSSQVRGLLQLDDDKINEGLDSHIEDFRKVMEKNFLSGQQKQAQRRRRFKEKPKGWDSDLDGHWTLQPEAIEELSSSPEPEKEGSRVRPTSGIMLNDDDDNLFEEEEPAVQKTTAKRAPTTRATRKAAAATRTTTATKKSAPVKKSTVASRGRKRANPFQDSAEEEEEDVIMDDDDDDRSAPSVRAPPPKLAPEARTRSAHKTRQTTLNFSQAQGPTRATQKAIEISDDEISEDDAFDSMPATRSRRR